MSSNATGAPAQADLTNCDREPIHIPGSIQPHGLLLALGEPGLVVDQATRNVEDHLGRAVEGVLGLPVEGVIGPDLARSLRVIAETRTLEGQPLFVGKGPLAIGDGSKPYDLSVHRSGGVLILEMEPATIDEVATYRDLYPLIQPLLASLEGASGVEEVCRLAAVEIRRITGFDRVLVYQFEHDWSGTVVAEDRNDVFPTLQGHRFPASDIPAQARALYRSSRVRLIADAGYRPSPIEPAANPRTGGPLDLSFAALRSVSPVHVEYLVNMGTAASMSISILQGGELWGLFACHNRDPRIVPLEVRTAGDFLGQVLTLQIAAKQQREDYEHRIGRKSVQVKLLAAMTRGDEFVEGLVENSADLLGLVEATGAAILHNGRCTLLGQAPDEAQVARIADWLEREGSNEVFSTDSLSGHMPSDEPSISQASGLLAIATSKLHRGYLFWFRPELIRTVTWGGDPNKAAQVAAGGRIHPRKSFEAWREIVRLRARPWRNSEVEAAVELRNAIVGIVLRRAEERAQLSAELERSNKELEAFSYSVSHDLRAPFRHIVGYSEMLREEEGDRLTDDGRRYVETVIESAQYAGTLVDNLLAFSRMGRTKIHPSPINMNTLVREAINDATIDAGGRKIAWEVGDLPPVEGDLMMIRLALGNLASNAVKYTRPRERAVIEIGAEDRGHEVVFHVKDNGIGFDMRYSDKLFGVFQRLHRMEDFEGTGIGLANVRRIMSRHGGRAWGEGEVDRGATFYFALPKVQTGLNDEE